jgi:hypothetical protein
MTRCSDDGHCRCCEEEDGVNLALICDACLAPKGLKHPNSDSHELALGILLSVTAAPRAVYTSQVLIGIFWRRCRIALTMCSPPVPFAEHGLPGTRLGPNKNGKKW